VKATDILMEEHRVIERVLSSLERASDRLNRGQEVYLRFFIGTSVFLKSFVDGCHHNKEEGVLFPALEDHGLTKEKGPVAVMLAEHQTGRELTQKLRLSTEQMQAGNVHKRDALIQSATAIIVHLRQHITKEDTILFPLADKIIPIEQQQLIMEGFKYFERDATGEDMHEKYYGLAERLERECVR
jgi:hemerythrin-like domain-containing protein